MIKIQELIVKEVKSFWGKDPSENRHNTLVIKTNNLSYEGKISYSDLVERNINKSSIKDNYLIPGDLLIEKSGGTKTHSVGYVNYFNGEKNKFVANNFILVLRPNFNKVFPKFLFYNMRFLYETGGFNDCYNKTTGIQNLNKTNYLSKKIKLPKYQDQINISDNLDTLDSCICTKQKELFYFDDLIKSRFNEMFEETNLSMQKEEWSTLSSVAIVYSGTTPNTSEPSYWNGNILWVTPAEINDDSYIINTTQRKITEAGKNSKSLSLMPEGTVLFSTRAPIGKVAIAGKPMTCNQGFKNFYCSDKINPIYLYFLLKSNIEFMQSIGTGSTFKEISRSKISNVKIPVSPIDMQNNFASFFKRIDKLKFIVQKQIDDLTELFNEKMDEYFNCDEEV